MSEQDTLLPCPFCGGKAEPSTGKHGDGTPWAYVQCTTYGCGALAEPDAWNERVPGFRTQAETGAWRPPLSDYSLGELQSEVHRRAQAFLGDPRKCVTWPPTPPEASS